MLADAGTVTTDTRWVSIDRPSDRETSSSIRQEKDTSRVVLMGSKGLSATVAARDRELHCSSSG